MSKQVTVYNLAELSRMFPVAVKRVHEQWADLVARTSDTPWADETFASLRAVVDRCGGKLVDWSIGAYSACSARVQGIDDHERDREWFLRNVLCPLGYVSENGRVRFPGVCGLTGYYADDVLLEETWAALNGGKTLTHALEGLATVAGRMMESNLEQRQSEDNMFANWGERFFTADGKPVD